MGEPNALDLLNRSYKAETAADVNAFDLLQQSYAEDNSQGGAMAQLNQRGFGSQQADTPQQGVVPGGIASYPVSPQEERDAWLREEIANGNIEPTPPSFWQKVYSELPQMAGEEVGAAAGAYGGARAAARLPSGHPLLKGGLIAGGAMVGAGVGAMGGKGYQQAYRMTKPGSKSMSFNDIYKEQLWSGVEGAVSEGLGRGVIAGGTKALKTGVGQKMLAPFQKELIPGIERLDAILKRAGRTLPPKEAAALTEHARDLLAGHGSFLTAAGKTQARSIDFVENAVEQSIFGGNRLFQLKRFLHPVTYKHAVKEMSDKFWKNAGERMSPQEVGQLWVDTITKERGVQHSLERIAYEQIGQVTRKKGKVLIPDLSGTQKLAQQAEKAAGMAGGSGQQAQIRTLAKKIQKWKYQTIGQYDPDLNHFVTAHSFRSNLLEEVRSMEAKEGRGLSKVRGFAKRVVASIDSAMEATARKAGPREYTAWRAANKFTKDGAALLDNEVVNGAMRLARRRPELVANKVFTKHGTDTLKAVQDAVGGKGSKTYQTLLASHLDDVITKHSGLAYETRMVPSGTAILDYMDKNLGEDMMEEMFTSPSHLQDFLDVMKLGFTLERKNQAGGGMLIQLLQAGGVADIGTKVLAGEAPKAASWLITAGPALLGRIFANPTGAKWLSTGFKLTGTAQEKWFAKIPPSLMRILREGTEEDKPVKQRRMQGTRF